MFPFAVAGRVGIETLFIGFWNCLGGCGAALVVKARCVDEMAFCSSSAKVLSGMPSRSSSEKKSSSPILAPSYAHCYTDRTRPASFFPNLEFLVFETRDSRARVSGLGPKKAAFTCAKQASCCEVTSRLFLRLCCRLRSLFLRAEYGVITLHCLLLNRQTEAPMFTP